MWYVFEVFSAVVKRIVVFVVRLESFWWVHYGIVKHNLVGFAVACEASHGVDFFLFTFRPPVIATLDHKIVPVELCGVYADWHCAKAFRFEGGVNAFD